MDIMSSYKVVWTPALGENLGVTQEPDNEHNSLELYAFRKFIDRVSHNPREYNRIF